MPVITATLLLCYLGLAALDLSEPKSLNVLFLNVQSIRNKVGQLEVPLLETLARYSISCLSEYWLRPGEAEFFKDALCILLPKERLTQQTKYWFTDLVRFINIKMSYLMEQFAPVTTGPNATHYNMNHKNRGMALIFNHENFKVPGTRLERRNGTKFDAKSLAKTLGELDFSVKRYEDLEYSKLKEVVDNAAALDHTDYDCFIMVVLTHGAENNILFCYDQKYDFDDLWTPFCANLCASLADKPKIFVVQACRGNSYMPLVSLDITETDGIPPNNNNNNIIRYNIPSTADFLFAFATIPGYYSWPNPNLIRGSWFIEALCKELKEKAYKFDILTILTFVNRRVAIDYESYSPQDPPGDKRKQISSIDSRLTRILQFNRKGENSDNAVVEKITPWKREKIESRLNQSVHQELLELNRKDTELRKLQFKIQKMKLKHPNVSWDSSEESE